jgi:hypothetical protein
VERIRDAVNNYYSQFDQPAEPDQAAGEFALETEIPVETAPEAVEEVPAVVEEVPEVLEEAPETTEGPAPETVEPPAESGTDAPKAAPEEVKESDTIGDLGSRPLS